MAKSGTLGCSPFFKEFHIPFFCFFFFSVSLVLCFIRFQQNNIGYVWLRLYFQTENKGHRQRLSKFQFILGLICIFQYKRKDLGSYFYSFKYLHKVFNLERTRIVAIHSLVHSCWQRPGLARHGYISLLYTMGSKYCMQCILCTM